MTLIDSWSPVGTTKLAGVVDAGQCGTSAVASGILLEGACAAVDGLYNAVALHPTPSPQALYRASTQRASGAAAYTVAGAAVAFDSAGTNGVLGMMCVNSTFSPSTQIVTKIGSTYTTRYSSVATALPTGPDAVEVRITFNGSNYVYSLYCNGVAVSGATWTDSASAIGTPGLYWGAAFQSLYGSGQQFKTDGITNMQANYTSAAAPTNPFFMAM